ncbi:PPE domain-containing protein [Mycobacterium asiaticum]|uniref:Secretion protein EspB n=1 Tax=Mycobacterium asiaticum TaxID=1790 RepID=A0A1A3MY57_MYCAS|nr:secretion protein EspB [Mycobacterium asiaticum]OBK13739.1 secretion protein EspB [Mycobacterium asiaticum]
MTQPQSVKVDQQEILSRATEVEAPMATPPTDVPVAPSGITTAINATEQIKLNAENMQMFLEVGARERTRLATSLRNAARAYGDVDEEGAAALDNDGGEVAGESAGGVGGDESAGLQDTPQVAVAGDDGYADMEATAKKLEAGDQGGSLSRMAEGWHKLSFAMQGDIKRFRIFKNWEGDAAEACEKSLDDQRIWIDYMAANATALAQQADYLAQLQVRARQAHPSSAAIALVRESAQEGNKDAIKMYADYQKRSEEVMNDYNTKASTQIKAFKLEKPPKAIKIDPPPPPQTPGLIPTQVMQVAGMAGGSGSGMQPPMMMPPTGGAGGGGMPAGVGAELTAAGRDAAASLPDGLGVKPMSLGGGGGGGGGMPAMPLAPATGAGPGLDGQSMRPAGAGDIAGMGAAGAARAGGMAGGGMGMPMGAHGQGGGGSKSKGSQQDDEALYTEDRAWTEAVIGQRRRQDMKESK